MHKQQYIQTRNRQQQTNSDSQITFDTDNLTVTESTSNILPHLQRNGESVTDFITVKSHKK